MSNELYTIIVSGEKIVFSKDQILSDPGNYFATYFFGEFAEGTQGTRELLVQKDIQLFRLIQAHLRGYEIFPLADAAIPSYMTKEAALANLLREAQFYCLDSLAAKIVKYQSEVTGKQAAPARRYAIQFQRFGDVRGWALQWMEPRGISEEQYKVFRDRYIHLPATYNPSHSEELPAGCVVHAYWTERNADDGQPALNWRLLVWDT